MNRKLYLRIVVSVFFIITSGQIFSAPNAATASIKKLNIFTCEPEWAALAHAIAGQHAEIFSATTYAQDPHRVEARPALIAKARQADVLICSGAELEQGWLPVLSRKASNAQISAGQAGYIMASDYLLLLNKPEKLDRSMGDVHAAGNPHVHFHPDNMHRMAQVVAERFSLLDANNAPAYQQGLQQFTYKLNDFLAHNKALTQKLKGTRIVVHHDTWVYFVQWLELEQVAIMESKAGIPPGVAHLSALLERVNPHTSDVIIYSSYEDAKAARWLSERSKVKAVQLDYSVRDWQAPDALFVWYQGLLDALAHTREIHHE